jgi:hypothetical protein
VLDQFEDVARKEILIGIAYGSVATDGESVMHFGRPYWIGIPRIAGSAFS